MLACDAFSVLNQFVNIIWAFATLFSGNNLFLALNLSKTTQDRWSNTWTKSQGLFKDLKLRRKGGSSLKES